MQVHKKQLLFACVFGLLFSATNTYIREIQPTTSLSLDNYGLWAIQTIGLTLLVAPCYILFQKFFNRFLISSSSPKAFSFFQRLSHRRFFFLIFFLHLIGYIPYLLAYYPGLFTYDVHTQIGQPYTTHHPLAHTLILKFFYKIGEVLFGSHTIGIAIASAVQMLLFVTVVSFLHLFLSKHRISLYLRIPFILWTLLVPFFCILSISMTKDILFSIFVLLFYICLYQWSFKPDTFQSKRFCLLFLISVISIIIFRNNGVYVLGLFVLVMAIFRFKQAKRLLIFSLTGILMGMSINIGLKHKLHAYEGSAKAMFSIPLQQLSYIYKYHHDQLEDTEERWIEEHIPNVKDYHYFLSDYVKKKSLIQDDIPGFIPLYSALLFRCPSSMINAFLLLNAGNFYVLDHSNAEIYSSGYKYRTGFLLTDTKEGFGVVHTSYFPALERLSERLFSANEYFKHPLLFILCSPAVYFWLIMLFLFYSIQERKKTTISVWIFVFSLILTIIASPCVLIRYTLPYILAVPIIISAYIENHRK